MTPEGTKLLGKYLTGANALFNLSVLSSASQLNNQYLQIALKYGQKNIFSAIRRKKAIIRQFRLHFI